MIGTGVQFISCRKTTVYQMHFFLPFISPELRAEFKVLFPHCRQLWQCFRKGFKKHICRRTVMLTYPSFETQESQNLFMHMHAWQRDCIANFFRNVIWGLFVRFWNTQMGVSASLLSTYTFWYELHSDLVQLKSTQLDQQSFSLPLQSSLGVVINHAYPPGLTSLYIMVSSPYMKSEWPPSSIG